ncbi:aspartyl protease [Lecanora helva]
MQRVSLVLVLLLGSHTLGIFLAGPVWHHTKARTPNGDDLVWDSFWNVGNVTVGKKEQQRFSTSFDTAENIDGSSITWFNGYSGSGKSLGRSKNITYADGTWVHGPMYRDDIDFDGFIAKDVDFVATSPDSMSGPWGTNAGLIGMAYSTKSSKAPGFFERLIQQNSVAVPEFSVFNARYDSEQSQLMLGGRDSTKFTGDLVTTPVVQEGGWNIYVDGCSVNGTMLSEVMNQSSSIALVDTGTELLYVPTAVGDAIFAAIPNAQAGALSDDGGYKNYTYPCDTPPELMPNFLISSVPLTIVPEDFYLRVADDDDSRCLSTLMGSNAWTFGEVFMKSFYTIFTWGELTKGNNIGKAAAVNFATAVQQSA